MIKHVFFDLDHTLWDFERNSAQAFNAIFLRNEIGLDIQRFLASYKPINERYWKLYREERISKPDLRFGRLRDAFDAIEHQVSDELIATLAIEYIEHLPNYNALFKGAQSVLDYLKVNYSLHIITNGFNEVQHLKLTNSNIAAYFDQVITSESVGVKKPNPKIFNHALEMAKARPSESLMIGDSIEADVLGALKVNMKAIHFNHDQRKIDHDITSINSLEELKQFL